MRKTFHVYLMTNPSRTVLYTGVTSDLPKRVWQHKMHVLDGFSKRYNVIDLVWYEEYPDAFSAIAREKQIKAGPRRQKIALVQAMNPNWRDLLALRACRGEIASPFRPLRLEGLAMTGWALMARSQAQHQPGGSASCLLLPRLLTRA
jgi:putative endonuclease